MADAKGRLQFLERGGGVLADVRPKFGGVEFAPGPPTGFGDQGVRFGGCEVAVDGTWGNAKSPGGLGFGTASFDKLHHPFPQIQRVSFHNHTLSDYLPMSM
jgi:hypothetical protein